MPPPWLEFTTSDPSFNATRVKPPGVIRTSSEPVSTKGRRSTWRGATPLSTKVGQVDKARVGWAMKFSGIAFSLARDASISSRVEVGPTSMP